MNWIKAEDRLPNVDTDVLVFVEGISYNSGPYKEISISFITNWYAFDNKTGLEWSCTMSNREIVTHWMPLPDAPKDEE